MFRVATVTALIILMAMVGWCGEDPDKPARRTGRDDDAVKPGELLFTEGGLIRETVGSGRHKLGPIGRGVHGLWNMVIAPFEIPATVMAEIQTRDNFIEGFIMGLGGGVLNLSVREAAGITEVVSIVVLKKTEPLYVRKLGEPAVLVDPVP